MIGKVLGDRYEIIEKIGGGGMALVYKAKCRLLNRFVAIKILRAEFTEDEEFVKKFKREAQAAASLSHPNIVGIYDVGIENGIHYIVMEYVKGQTLKDLIKSKGSLGIDQATNLAIQISSAIEHAHKNHIVHRDIKSHNILIREDNSVKVTDFGIARAVSSCTITNTGNIIGSVHYFSPEQARGGYTDEKSDIYSLGVVMYEMVTGMLPFEGESPIAIALKHIQEIPVKPAQLNTRIPRSIEDIILKCMEKEVSRRYDNAVDIINDLKQSMVMPNGSFVKRQPAYTDESTKVLEPIKNIGVTLKNDTINDIKDEEPYYDKSDDSAEIAPVSKRKSKTLAISMVLGGLILAVVVFGAFMLLRGMFSVDEVVVPDITNMTETEALEKLKSMGLFMEVVQRVHNTEYADGTIISQDPEAKEKNKVTNPVKVVISKGPMPVKVPDLRGKNYDEVKLILEKMNLVEGEFTQVYHEYPYGVVVDQKITPGLEVAEGTVIDYVISMGPEKFIMPDYVGQNIDTVKDDLALNEIIIQNQFEEYSNEYEAGVVINQSIKPGTEVSRKSLIDLTVSLGKEPEKSTEFSLKVPLPSGLEGAKITVFKVQGDQKDKIYENFHDSKDSPLMIPVSGSGKVTFEVYINGTLHGTESHDFGQ
ncbi:MAG: Stk1 family PASTA domain-containing Ser/Thr kinase [Bacillota bacterium]